MSNFPSPEAPTPLLVFGAHPDDIEFGCGAIVAGETARGRSAHLVICSRGESASHGSPAQRVAEAEGGAAHLGASVEFIDLDGDAHLELRAAHAITLARVIRRVRPVILLAPTVEENQHPDHWRLGRLVGDAARLARYGGVAELRAEPAYAIGALFHYAITPEAEPHDGAGAILIDVSDRASMQKWRDALQAHASQVATRPYEELQLARARLLGLRAGVEYAQALYPAAPPLFASLDALTGSARQF